MIAYAPAHPDYGRWYASTIRHPLDGSDGRATLAGWLLTIRRRHGATEATRFRDWLVYLGTYPVVNHLRGRNAKRYTLCAPGCYPRTIEAPSLIDAVERYRRAVNWTTAGQHTPAAQDVELRLMHREADAARTVADSRPY